METISLIVSIVGTLSGVIGLVVTFMTWKNTRKITKMVNAEKIKSAYKIQHSKYLQGIQNALNLLIEGDNSYRIVTGILRVCRSIQKHNDNWETDEKKTINKFVKKINKIPSNQNIEKTTKEELIKELIELETMLERIGALNDIGKI